MMVAMLNLSYLPQNITSMDDSTTTRTNFFAVNEVTTTSSKKKGSTGSSRSSSKEWALRLNEQGAKNEVVEKKKEKNNNNKRSNNTKANSKIAGLNCDRFGGPSEEIAEEMVYWRDVPSDSQFQSPYAHYGPQPKYLTFEPDEAGWNNVRMSMETATALAHAMGRILVLPPAQHIHLLNNGRGVNNQFTFKQFFPFDEISEEHPAVEVISMEEFLLREFFSNKTLGSDGQPIYPPHHRSNWEGRVQKGSNFWMWLRNVTKSPMWDSSICPLSFPNEPGPDGVKRLYELLEKMNIWNGPRVDVQKYINHPTPVNASPEDRLSEMVSQRKGACVYDVMYQNAKVIHFMGDGNSGARLLVHFYAFLFFEDWKQDLWTKRYIRDHLRYIDEIQCAAAKIVHAVREKAKENGNPYGQFDSMHIRRGDFLLQYRHAQIEADDIYENIKDVINEKSTLFIATDEKNTEFFKPLMDHYVVYFLKDFLHLIPSLNKNYYGMLDQLIASRGETFCGAYFSTFTGYINRIRGYHSQKSKALGWKDGKLKSYHYVEKKHKNELINYYPLKGLLWGREFPVSWRDIDHDLTPSQILA
jgi:hypothetical protein